jgi:hypothetical protein
LFWSRKRSGSEALWVGWTGKEAGKKELGRLFLEKGGEGVRKTKSGKREGRGTTDRNGEGEGEGKKKKMDWSRNKKVGREGRGRARGLGKKTKFRKVEKVN